MGGSRAGRSPRVGWIRNLGGFHGLGGPFSSSVFMHVTRIWIAAIDWLATELPPMVLSLILYMLGKR